MNEAPKTKILIHGGDPPSLQVAIYVDTETDDLGGFRFLIIMALIRGDIKRCS